jgi:Domain of unknown function (DUF1840)
MIYKFKSKAAGDLIMLGPNGDQLLRILGKQPAAEGIIEPAGMIEGIAALQEAVRADEQQAEGAQRKGVSLRQRVWPMVEMMRRSHAAAQPIVWGV